jgi:hypothetical protein
MLGPKSIKASINNTTTAPLTPDGFTRMKLIKGKNTINRAWTICYHGTSEVNASGIIEDGFVLSKNGMLILC